MSYRFSVNGEAVELDVPGMRRLLDVLRQQPANRKRIERGHQLALCEIA